MFGMLSRVLVVFVFILSSSGAAVPLLRQQSGSTLAPTQSDPVTQAMWAMIYVIVIVLIMMRWQRFAYVITRDGLLLLLVGLALLSTVWSAAPKITLVQCVALVGTTLTGAYLATRYSLAEQLQLLAVALGVIALLSLALGLMVPSYGISHSISTAGNWQGIFNHKNALGRSMALGMIVFSIRAVSISRYRWLAWSGVGLSGVLLLLANSITGMVVALLILGLWPVYRALRWRHTIALPLIIAALLVSGGLTVVFADNAASVLGFLGRDQTLSGRTVVWAAVLDSIRERPWLGYGYNAFWLGWEGPSAQVWLATGAPFVNAQNGILDLWLRLGLVGIVLFAAQALRSFLRSVSWVRFTNTVEGLWPIAFLTFFLLYNASESITLEQNNMYWILYVATVLSISIRPPRQPKRGTSNVTPARPISVGAA